MPIIEFPATCAYLSVPPLGRVPAIEVELIYGRRNARVVGLLDSGSTVTVFSREVAGVLGIEDVTVGDLSAVRTLAGSLPFFIFDMEMAVHLPGLTGRFPERIGFFSSATGRNILGRNLIFSHFEIAFRERTRELKFRPEETEGAIVDIVKGNMGWIEVVVGPMFSGKSEELIRRLRRAEIGRQRVQIFKPVIDQRYASNGIVSHSGLEMNSELVKDADEIMQRVEPRTEVVGIDEGQFLGEQLVENCSRLADMGKRVIVAGLDTDFLGRPFEPMPRLLAVAEEITKVLAICVRCGNPAVHTQRLVASEELVVVGAGGMYEARCRRCFEPQLARLKLEEEKARGGSMRVVPAQAG